MIDRAIRLPSHSPAGYAFAAGTVLVALLIRLLVENVVPGTVPFAVFFPAILIATAVAGLSAGILALALSAVLVDLMLVEPRWALLVASPVDLASLVMFVLSALLMIGAGFALRLAALRYRRAATALRQTALERADALATLDALLEHAPLGFAFFDREHRYVRINAELARINGLPVDAHLGRRLRDLLPVNARAVEPILEEVFGTGAPRRDIEVTGETPAQPDIERTWLTSFYPVRGGEGRMSPRLVGVTVIEITGRKRAEAALARSEERLRGLADAMPHLAWTSESGGHDEWFNERWREELDVASAEGISSWRDLVHPDDRPGVQASWVASLASGEPFAVECRFRARNAGYRWYLCRAVSVRDERGQVRRWFGTCTDISAMVAARELVGRHRQELEQEVAARTAELAAALDRLQRETDERRQAEEQLRQAHKMEALGQLTGGIAHDFNNLLTVVIGNLDSLGLRLPPDADPRLRRAVESALAGAERAAQLTQRLLAFARRRPVAPRPSDINRVLAGMADLIVRALNRESTLELELGAGLWPVEIDPTQLESTVLNLAVNARDAMPEGGRLLIETANRRLDGPLPGAPGELPPGVYVVLSVSDTGRGMDEAVQARAFEPFFTTKGTGQGTGLGLSQVYGFARESGGMVAIDSGPGCGTRVSLFLPPLRPVGREAEGSPEPPVPSSECVLLLGEPNGNSVLLVERLIEWGLGVVQISRPAAAVRRLGDGGEFAALLITSDPAADPEVAALIGDTRRLCPNLPIITGDVPDLEAALLTVVRPEKPGGS